MLSLSAPQVLPSMQGLLLICSTSCTLLPGSMVPQASVRPPCDSQVICSANTAVLPSERARMNAERSADIKTSLLAVGAVAQLRSRDRVVRHHDERQAHTLRAAAETRAEFRGGRATIFS